MVRAKGKTVQVEEAVRAINDGDWVVVSHGAAIPQVVLREMVRQRERFADVRIFHVLPMGYGEYLLPECAGNFRHVTTFAGVGSREAVNEGRADFIPCFFKDVPALMGREVPVDVVVVHVSPPDGEGWCSLGLSCDYMPAAIAAARVVIAQVNKCMPRVGGRANEVHVSRFDHIVECEDAIPELVRGGVTEAEMGVARNVAALVEDGDTLQLGIGSIPDSVLGFLGGHKHLGLHSEVFSDGAMELMRAGVIDGERKTLLPGKAVATFLTGTKEFYNFVASNPSVEMRPVDWVNDPRVIGQNDRMVSINSCIEVDLMGQVNAESIGTKQFSGIGGQTDFVRGVRLSKGGRSIIAMVSTARGGTVSRIVPVLTAGSAVTTTRGDVDVVVTEYGAAHLRGLNLRQRACALRAVAHPDFREFLIR